MYSVFDPFFWRQAGGSLWRTFVAAVVPFVLVLIQDPAANWRQAVGVIVPTLIYAIATSLKGTVDPASASYPVILFARFLRQVGQFAAGALTGLVIFWDYDWKTLALQALASGLTTVLLNSVTLLPAETASAVLPGEVVPIDIPEDGGFEPDPSSGILNVTANTALEGTEGASKI